MNGGFSGRMDFNSMAGQFGTAGMIAYCIFVLALGIFGIIVSWKVFKKAGRPGWACIIPIYNIYVMFDIVYGKGIKFLLLLIPFYNIYVIIKFAIDMAHVFGKSTGFGIGILFLSVIFYAILAFGDARYLGPVGSNTVSATVSVEDESDARAQALAKLKAKAKANDE